MPNMLVRNSVSPAGTGGIGNLDPPACRSDARPAPVASVESVDDARQGASRDSESHPYLRFTLVNDLRMPGRSAAEPSFGDSHATY